QKYGPKLKAARELGTDDEIQARAESLAEEEQMDDPIISVLKHYGAPENRDDYLDLAYAGEPPVDSDRELPAEIEAALPEKFSGPHSTRTSSSKRNNRRKGEAAANLRWAFHLMPAVQAGG